MRRMTHHKRSEKVIYRWHNQQKNYKNHTRFDSRMEISVFELCEKYANLIQIWRDNVHSSHNKDVFLK